MCIIAAALLSGCATGPKFAAVSGSIPGLGADTGRIYVYRTTVAGAAIQPEVKLDGQVVGRAKPKGFFYVDRPAGNYVLTCATEVERKLSFTLEKGQTRYVRLGISLGFMVGHVYPELVDPAEGAKEIQGCSYTGSALAGP